MGNIDPKHIEFFNELKELLKKHRAFISNDSMHVMFNFKGDPRGKYYQTDYVLYCSELSDTFKWIELVTTERVLK